MTRFKSKAESSDGLSVALSPAVWSRVDGAVLGLPATLPRDDAELVGLLRSAGLPARVASAPNVVEAVRRRHAWLASFEKGGGS